jgi:glycosyltransferase involved in cell wall biosynthesis
VTEDPVEISIVVPIYNEEDNVDPLCDAIRDALDGWPRSFELVLVDDGSADGTAQRIRAQQREDPRIRSLRMAANAGQTAAMAAGFASARGRIIVSMDGDLQNDPRDIPLLVERLERGFDVVCGWRKDRQDAFLSRTLPSRIANRMIAWITGVPIHDNGCSLKAYRAAVIQSLNLYSDMHRFLPALSSMTGARIDEVVVRHHPRTRGESKYGITRTFKVLADVLTIKMITQFSGRPGLWFALLSLPWLVLAIASIAAWLLSLRVFPDGTIVFSSLAVVFFYLFGSLIGLSLLGEILLAHRDRRYLRRLAEVLTAEVEPCAAPARSPARVRLHRPPELGER